MFLQPSVILFTGVSILACNGQGGVDSPGHTPNHPHPLGRHPPPTTTEAVGMQPSDVTAQAGTGLSLYSVLAQIRSPCEQSKC